MSLIKITKGSWEREGRDQFGRHEKGSKDRNDNRKLSKQCKTTHKFPGFHQAGPLKAQEN